jgi:hypothetical protein
MMSGRINHLPAICRMSFLALAFALAVAGRSAAAQQPAAPGDIEDNMPWQVHELISLLEDPAVHAWIERQRTAGKQPEGSSEVPLVSQDAVFNYTAQSLTWIRQHLDSLVRALPDLPREFRQAGAVLLGELRDWGLIDVGLLIFVFVLLGSGLEWLLWRATAPLRAQLMERDLKTESERLHVVALRFAIGLGLVIAFTTGSVGAFLTFDWPPLLRDVVLGYLMAFLAVRLSLVIGRFLLAPQAEPLRVIPVTTPQAHFWQFRLALLIGWFAFGRFTIELLGILGTSLEVRQIVAYVLASGCSVSALKVSGELRIRTMLCKITPGPGCSPSASPDYGSCGLRALCPSSGLWRSP